MSNPANYSPYNKTYKFILYQNQAYHQKNKRNAKPCVKTNIRYRRVNEKAEFFNPELSEAAFNSSCEQPKTCNTNGYESSRNSFNKSMQCSRYSQFLQRGNSGPHIDRPKRVIHKNESYEKFNQLRIDNSNREMVSRLVDTQCEVIRNKHSAKSFRKHLKYRQIRNKYDSEGKRKHGLALGNISYLCPTLREFKRSGLGSKFLKEDLSMSRSPTKSPNFKEAFNKFSKGA